MATISEMLAQGWHYQRTGDRPRAVTFMPPKKASPDRFLPRSPATDFALPICRFVQYSGEENCIALHSPQRRVLIFLRPGCAPNSCEARDELALFSFGNVTPTVAGRPAFAGRVTTDLAVAGL